jgi:hypothetical protein
MTYLAGLAGFGGGTDRSPHVICDGCGLKAQLLKPGGMPYAWALNKKPPPGWAMERTEEPYSRTDYCRDCRAPKGK